MDDVELVRWAIGKSARVISQEDLYRAFKASQLKD